ncbi:protein linkin [Ditylenchus destructor]|uniref:Protein linkin n=1 Tax=Ditylenchus destructor TaxID=166010 RepID=A0AAD4N256_9BILA|nr:protein linkin [Ditylenchus destructor]
MNTDIEKTQQRIKQSVDGFVDDLDKKHLREFQRVMFMCSASCVEDKRSDRKSVEDCIEKCNEDMKRIQAKLEQELGTLQEQLSRCSMTCYDKQIQKFGTDPNTYTEDQMMKFTQNLDQCVAKCADDHIKLLPSIKDRFDEARNMTFDFLCLNVLLLYITCASCSLNLNIVEEEFRPALEGRICAYGDMDKNSYTDLIVQQGNSLVIMTQSEQGAFSEAKSFGQIPLPDGVNVFCSVGDFNGDAALDIMVTQPVTEKTFLIFTHDKGYNSTLYLFKDGKFVPRPIDEVVFRDQPTIMDINGDGASDVVGFVQKDEGTQLYCLAGDKNDKFSLCEKNFKDFDNSLEPFPSAAPIFADIDGDLSSEVVFIMHNKSNDRPELQVWSLSSPDFVWKKNEEYSSFMIDNPSILYYGGPLVSDFNADAVLDILFPGCREETCRHVTHFNIWTKGVWSSFQLDQKDVEFVTDEKSKTIFRVGDFSLDGFPDLIATVKTSGKNAMPMILDNIASDSASFSRKFELRTSPRMVMPAEMSQNDVDLSAFFDLKEDGNLDILVEYKDSKTGKMKIDFIKCDDKGDTTFLKVQVFTNVCTNDCPYSEKSSRRSDIGSGVTWHGACVSFRMTDPYGGDRISLQCQLPQTSHRVLHSPFVLFGLGRSPNFVDDVRLGIPRWRDNGDNQRTTLKQIVPNSRIIVVPPEGEGTHWQSRLYLTPSRLIIQSLLVLVSVCGILLILVVFLHFRERQQDRKERQAQTHRFHFDAM